MNTSTQLTPSQIHISPKVNCSLTYVLFNLLVLLSAMGDCIFQNGHTYGPPHKLLFQCDLCLLLQPELGLYSLPLNLGRDYWLPPPVEYSTSEVMWLGGHVQPEMWIKSPQMIPVPSFQPFQLSPQTSWIRDKLSLLCLVWIHDPQKQWEKINGYNGYCCF